MEEGIEEEVEISVDLTVPHISRSQVEKLLGFKPKDVDLYRNAMVHKSVLKGIQNMEDKGNVQKYMLKSNERMEFLGDSVIDFVVSEIIYHKYEDEDEGFLTRLRTKIVRGTHCAKFAKILDLGSFILTGNKVVRIKDQTGKVYNNRILEDSFEALIGAIHLDMGFEFARLFLKKLINENVNFEELMYDDNYKDILMRFTQANSYELPIYETIDIIGKPHDRIFNMKVKIISKDGTVVGKYEGMGQGHTKKEAEQNAAMDSISKIEKELIDPIIKRSI